MTFSLSNFSTGTLGRQLVDQLRPKWRGMGVPIESIVEDIVAIIENGEVDPGDLALGEHIAELEEQLASCREEWAVAQERLMKIRKALDDR